jgi:hypothetical protein
MSERYKCAECSYFFSDEKPTCCPKCGCEKAVEAPRLINSNAIDGQAQRINDGKPRMDLVPVSMMNALARVLTYGAKKYDADNWRRGFKYSVPYACLLRHLTQWWDGEDRDKESGLSHLDHVAANLAMLIEFERDCPHLDDRWSTRLKQAQPKDISSGK